MRQAEATYKGVYGWFYALVLIISTNLGHLFMHLNGLFVRIAGILMVYVAVKHSAIPAYTIVYSCYLLTYGDGECD
jgi:hypothetical protein